jgi:hypothetical protein
MIPTLYCFIKLNYEKDSIISIGQRDEKGTTSLLHPDKK